MRHQFLILFTIVQTVLFGQEVQVSIEDIWEDYKFYPKQLDDFHWVGTHEYAELENKHTFKPRIVTYSVESGEQKSVLLASKKYESFIKNVLKSKKVPVGKGEIDLRNYLVNDFEIGPNRKYLLLKIGGDMVYRYSSKSFLVIYDIENSLFSFVPTTEKVFYPQFSPDGSMLSYVESNDLFVFDLKKKTVRQLTKTGKQNEILNGMSDWVYEEEFELTQAYEWSLDSKEIAFLNFDERKVKTYKMQFWKEQLYPEDYSFKYPKAGGENSKIKVAKVSVSNAKVVILKDYSEEDIYIPRIYWVRGSVMILKLNRLQNELKMLQFSDNKKKEKIIYTEKDDKYIEWKDHLFFVEDGFVVSGEESGNRHLYYYDNEGKLITNLTQGGWEVDDVFGVTEGGVYFTSTEKSIFERPVYKVDFQGNKKIIVDLKGINELQISPDGEFLVNHNSSVHLPDNYNIIDSEGAFVRAVETNDDLYETLQLLSVPTPEYFQYENSNGDTLNAYMLKPTDYDSTKKYPVLFYVYGGPGFQVLKNKYDGFNYFWHMHLTELGYIVVLADARGTGGRGRGFRDQTYGRLGELESSDLMELAEHVKLMPFTDENRIGIWGWSYGGYLSSLVAMQGGTFNVAIAVAPVTSWRFYDSVYSERYLGLPKDNTHGYDWNSPINYAEGLDGKYLLIHGTGDDNVHIQNSMSMQNALIEANKQFDVFYYPDRNHGIYGGNTRLHLYHMMTDYLLKNL